MRKIVNVLILLGGLYAAYPYFTLWRLSEAAKHGDEAALTTLVDWPKLRQGFKNDVSGTVDSELSGDDGPLSTPRDVFSTAMSKIVAPVIAGSVIDVLVTPKGLAALLCSGDARASSSARASAGTCGNQDEMKLAYAFFQSPTVFRVVLEDKNDPSHKLPMLLELEGASWRLTRVYLR